MLCAPVWDRIVAIHKQIFKVIWFFDANEILNMKTFERIIFRWKFFGCNLLKTHFQIDSIFFSLLTKSKRTNHGPNFNVSIELSIKNSNRKWWCRSNVLNRLKMLCSSEFKIPNNVCIVVKLNVREKLFELIG